MPRFLTLIALFAVAFSLAAVPQTQVSGTVFPEPQKIEMKDFSIPVSPESVRISVSGDLTITAARAMMLYTDTVKSLAGDDAEGENIFITFSIDEEGAQPPQGYTIKCEQNNRRGHTGTMVRITAADQRGLYYAFATMRQLLEVRDGVLYQNFADIEDYPVWQHRFVTDYFVHLNMQGFENVAANKLGGAAMLVNSNWLKPDFRVTAQPTLTNMKKMHDEGIMDFFVQLHLYHNQLPAAEKFNVLNEEHVKHLIDTCRWFADHGGTVFMIAVDDLTPYHPLDGYSCYHEDEKERFNDNVGSAHGYLMRVLSEAMKEDYPNVTFSMVAAPYSFAHGIGRPEVDRYVTGWAEEAPEDVFWVWTGTGIYSPFIAKEHYDRMGTLLKGHPQFIFDNSNGYFFPTPRWETLYFDGMEKESKGISYQHGLFYGGRPLETIYYFTVGDYLWNPKAYDADRSYANALRMVFGEAAVKPLQELFAAVRNYHMVIGATDKDKAAAARDQLIPAAAGIKGIIDMRGRQIFDDRLDSHVRDITEYASFNHKELVIPKRTAEITIDGNITEEEWRDAVKFELTLRTGEEAEPVIARAAYGDDGLYLSFDIPLDTPLPEGEKLRHDSTIWENPDVLEIFIQPAPITDAIYDADATGHYMQLTLDHVGNRYDGYTTDNPLGWNVDWKSEVVVTPERWSAELFVKTNGITIPGIDECLPALPGSVWKANFHRAENRTGRIFSWDGASPKFHRPRYFGTVTFAE